VAGGSDSSDKVATDGSPPRRQWGGAPATRRRRGMRRLSRRLASPTRRRIRWARAARWRFPPPSAIGGGKGGVRGVGGRRPPKSFSSPPQPKSRSARRRHQHCRVPTGTAPDRRPVGGVRRRHDGWWRPETAAEGQSGRPTESRRRTRRSAMPTTSRAAPTPVAASAPAGRRPQGMSHRSRRRRRLGWGWEHGDRGGSARPQGEGGA